MNQPDFDVVVSSADREAWLAARRKGIGSSDAPAALGLNPWRTPLELYAEKLGLEEPAEQAEAAFWGSVLEPFVIARFARATGRMVTTEGTLIRSRARPWQLATLDGAQQPPDGRRGPGVLEAKCTSLEGRWSEGPPPYVVAQVQHQLAVTGWSWGSVAVLFGGREFFWLDFERDEEMIAWLIEGEAAFWKHVEELSAPEPTGTEADRKIIAKLFPKDTDPEPLVLDGSWLDVDERRDEILTEAKRSAAELLEIENRLKLAIGKHSSAVLPNGVTYTLKQQTRKSYTVDEATFRVLRRVESKRKG